MLLCHRKSIVNNILVVISFILSFAIRGDEWRFIISIVTCILAYRTVITAGNDDYLRKVYQGLERKTGRQLGYMKEFSKKDWHTFIHTPSVIIMLGVGVYISPHRLLGTSYGWADYVCGIGGLFLSSALSRACFPEHENKMIEKEIERLSKKLTKGE